MTLIQDILENEKYILLIDLKHENEKLSDKYNKNYSSYSKLIRRGLGKLTSKRILTSLTDGRSEYSKLGLNKIGIGRYPARSNWEGKLNPIDTLYSLKNINWKELGNKLNLKDDKIERYNTIMKSLEDYDIDDSEIVREVDKAIINNNGGKTFLKSLKVNGGSYMLVDKNWEFSQSLGEGISDFLTLEQLYDDFIEMACEFKSSVKIKIEHNIQVNDKLKEDLSYYFIIDTL